MQQDNAIQMAAYLLALHAERQPNEHGIEPLRLSQLLYAAERRSLQKYGESISDAELVALPQGPALGSILYELDCVIRGTATSAWAEWFRAEGNRIALKKAPRLELDSTDLDALCEADLSILRWVERTLGGRSADELGEHMRRSCKEWRATIQHDAEPISLEDVFRALDFTEEETQAQVGAHREHLELREANRELLC